MHVVLCTVSVFVMCCQSVSVSVVCVVLEGLVPPGSLPWKFAFSELSGPSTLTCTVGWIVLGQVVVYFVPDNWSPAIAPALASQGPCQD